MYLIAGLGNPGPEYKWTRHNVGFEFINKLAYDYSINMNKNKFRAIVGDGFIEGKKVILIKPLTYMNLSGESICEFMNFYKLPIENLIVCCDDINLDVATIRIRKKGSDGGQNGLKNIINQLGSNEFSRIRIGVGKKPPKFDLKDYVLSKFFEEENNDIISGITKATDSIKIILNDSVDNAMNIYNKKISNNNGNEIL